MPRRSRYAKHRPFVFEELAELMAGPRWARRTGAKDGDPPLASYFRDEDDRIDAYWSTYRDRLLRRLVESKQYAWSLSAIETDERIIAANDLAKQRRAVRRRQVLESEPDSGELAAIDERIDALLADHPEARS